MSDDPTVFELHGELDISISEGLLAALTVTGGHVVLDMENVTFIDSSAIGAVIRARKVGIDVTIQHPSEPVARVLDMSGLERLLVDV